MLKTRLQQITEKAKLKSTFNEDIKKFANIILQGWLEKCSLAANESEDYINLVAFRADATFENNKIRYFLKNGLIEHISQETSLDTTLHEYIVNKEHKKVDEVFSEIPFENILLNDTLYHFYVIRLNWKK